ncbi:MAG TPA: 4-alpha-glucanotransferase, partial [Methylomirabilota bacterium]|nr:4-alpha-glucanotransferase [Methylomirabilota bacterium]
RFVAEMGGDFVGSLPLTATFLSKPFEPSPYSPASRLFWSEYFIDVQTAPELQHSRPARKLLESDSFKRSVKQFRSSPTVSYVQEMQLKRRALEALAETLDRSRGARREAFEQFLRLRPDAQEYAAFRAVGEKLQSSWHTWPEQARRGRITPADYREADFRYHLYAQFLAQEQISALLRAYERDGVSLYLDLPVGVNSDSYDVWRNRSQFVSSVSCGAPPDIFFREGQDWGFPPLNPIELRKSHYAYWRKVMRFQLKHAKLLRLDHVMGLHRLYWIPHGRSAKDGAYVHYNAEELFAILCVESHLNEAVVIGENLGTVPQEITRAMRKHSVRGMSILQFEHQPRQPALKEPPRAVLATLDTHDTPTFAAFVTGADIALRQTLGLLKAKEVASERRRRQKLIKAFADFLKKRRLITSSEPNPTDLLRGALRWLAKGRADIVLIPLEDLWLEINAQNVPGTTDQHPNWQRKARLTLEEMLGSVHVRTLLNEVSEARHPAQRTIHKSRTQK